MNRLATLGAAAALTAAAAMICVPKADAVPFPTLGLQVSASGPTNGAATTATITAVVTVDGGTATGVLLDSNAVPGRVTSVTVDGHTAPAAAYEADVSPNPERTRLVVRVNDGASAATPGSLAEGTHTVAIKTDLANRSGGPLRAELELADATASPSSTATATIPLPDLSISVPKQAPGANGLSLPPGGESELFAEVRHRGAAVTASTLTITLPSGLQIDPREGVFRLDEDDEKGEGDAELRCTSTSATQLRCPLGAVSDEVDILIELTASPTAKPRSTGTIALTVEADNGLDATPADNTARTAVTIVPPAHLRTTLKADDSSIEVGSDGHLTATVTNEGTDPVSVFGVVAVGNSLDKETKKSKQHFAITKFTGREDLPDEGGDSGSVPAARAMASAVTIGGDAASTNEFRAMARQAGSKSAAAKGDPTLRFWNIGTLAPGATAKAVVTVRAKSVGTGAAIALATSPVGVSSCLRAADDEKAFTRCPEVGYVKLNAVAGAGTNGDGTLAATGVPTTQLTLLGCTLLMLGGLSLYAGSARSRIVGRHRS